MKLKIYLLVLILLSGIGSLYALTITGDRNVEKEIKPVKVYKDSQLRDMSDDGKYLLLDYTKIPFRRYTIFSDGTAKAHQPDDTGDAIRVVELESGGEIAKLKISFEKYDQFVPNTKQIFYEDTNNKIYQIWDYESDVKKACFDESKFNLQFVIFLNEKLAFGVIPKKEKHTGQWFATLELPSCEVKIIGEVYPNPDKNEIGYNLTGKIQISSDKKNIIYLTYKNNMVVRDVETFKIINEFSLENLQLLSKYQFTPDGRYFVVLAKTYVSPKHSYMLIYNANTFKQVHQFEVLGDESLAISPDSRFAAVAYKAVEKDFFKKTEQAHIVLIDLETGKEVAKMSHPKLKEKRNDPFQADVNKMIFTSDRKYLLTSTYDTYVWDISQFTQNK